MPQSFIKHLKGASRNVLGAVSKHVLYNAAYYAQGWVDGKQDSMDNLNIVYTYHVHEGSAGVTANGCYTTPIYHSHISTCYSEEKTCYATPSERYIDGRTWIGYDHSACGASWDGVDWKDGSSGYNSSYNAYSHTYKNLICNKTNSTIDDYVLGCGKTEDTIESATIIY